MTIVIVRLANAFNTRASYRRLLPLSLWRLATQTVAGKLLVLVCAAWTCGVCGSMLRMPTRLASLPLPLQAATVQRSSHDIRWSNTWSQLLWRDDQPVFPNPAKSRPACVPSADRCILFLPKTQPKALRDRRRSYRNPAANLSVVHPTTVPADLSYYVLWVACHSSASIDVRWSTCSDMLWV